MHASGLVEQQRVANSLVKKHAASCLIQLLRRDVRCVVVYSAGLPCEELHSLPMQTVLSVLTVVLLGNAALSLGVCD